MSNTRINGIEHIEQALRTLESYGYDTSTVWAEHNEWLKTQDTRECTDYDRTWATRAKAPSSVEEHSVSGLFECLTATNCFVDRQYSLSPAARDVLRERHGLTPAMVVLTTSVVTYPGTDVVWSLTIKSAEHIDPRRRKHVLVEAVIQPASKFFEAVSIREKEREAEAEEADKKRVKRGEEPKSVKAKAAAYLTNLQYI